MLELYRAEWIKIAGHRRSVVYLLGVFPLSAAFLLFFAGLIASVEPSFQETAAAYLSSWTDLLLKAWSLPNQPVGRILLMAFTAFAFAGEYQWGTWKNLTPRKDRAALVLIKLMVVSVLVLLTFTLTSVVMAVGGSAASTAAGVDVTPAFTPQQVGKILPDYLLSASTAFLAFLITAIFAAFASIYSRSILGGCVAGIVLIFAEVLFFLVPRWLSSLLENPSILHLQRAVPIYNLENIRSWAQAGTASSMLDHTFTSAGLPAPADGALFSLALIATWIILGITIVIQIFQRQDITT